MKAVRLVMLLVVAGLCSCKPSKDLVYQNIENFKLRQAGTGQATLCMDIRLYNPNNRIIKLKEADVDVFLDGTRLGKMRVNGKCSVSRLDTFSLPVLLDVDLKNVLPNAFRLLTNSDMNVVLAGTIKAGRYGMYKKVPINYEGRQDLLSGMKLW